MTTKKFICLTTSLLAVCNIAKSDPTPDVQARVKQVEAERAKNDLQISSFIRDQGNKLHTAQVQLDQLNTNYIPSLQKQISSLQDDDAKVNAQYSAMSKKYSKLKTAFVTIGSLFMGGLVLLILLKSNVLLPYGWIAIPVCMGVTTTFLVWKL